MENPDRPILLRGHHVESARNIFVDNSRKDFIDLLIKNGYICDASDNFISQSYDRLIDIFSSPLQKILIVGNQPDFICNSCRKKEDCVKPLDHRRILGGAFQVKDPDYEVSERYGLEVGKVYTAKEIRERADF